MDCLFVAQSNLSQDGYLGRALSVRASYRELEKVTEELASRMTAFKSRARLKEE